MPATVLLFYPGIVTYDSAIQYNEAISGHFTNTHPAAMAAVWRLLRQAGPGPLPMLLFDQILYWGSFASLAIFCLRRTGRPVALIAASGGLFPLILNFSGVIWKDVVLAAAWGFSCALMLLASDLRRGVRFSVCAATAAALLIFGAAVRHNAAPAAIVLAFAFVITLVRGHAARVVIFGVLAVLATLAVPLSDRMLHARDERPITNLISWDLTGISFFSGRDYRGDPSVGHPAVGCYSPRLFDACPLVPFANADEALSRWATAIRQQPVAYLKHRTLTFAMLMRFGCRACQPSIAPTDLSSSRHFVRRAFVSVVTAIGATPLGRPYFWLTAAICLAALLWRHADPRDQRLLPFIPLSGAVYALSFYPSAVTDEFRYNYWLIYSVVFAVVAYLLINRISARDMVRWLLIPIVGVILLDVGTQMVSPTDRIAPSMQTNY